LTHAVDFLNQKSGEALALTDPAGTVATFAIALLIGCKILSFFSLIYVQAINDH
jgi:hypothetical protein